MFLDFLLTLIDSSGENMIMLGIHKQCSCLAINKMEIIRQKIPNSHIFLACFIVHRKLDLHSSMYFLFAIQSSKNQRLHLCVTLVNHSSYIVFPLLLSYLFLLSFALGPYSISTHLFGLEND